MKILGMFLFPRSSVAKKILMALSGLLIFGFLFFHLAGNLFLYKGQEAFNAYAHKLAELGPILYVAETALALLFLYHALQGIRVTLDNRKARKQGYDGQKRLGKGTFMSRTMAVSGTVILVFLVVHIWNFRLQKEAAGKVPLAHAQIERVVDSGGDPYLTTHATAADDLYTVVVLTFQNRAYVAFYVLAMCCMGLHLAHAGQSALRTLGLSQGTYLNYARGISALLAAFFVVAFSAFPLYFHIMGFSADPHYMPSAHPKNPAYAQQYVQDVEKQIERQSTPVQPETPEVSE